MKKNKIVLFSTLLLLSISVKDIEAHGDETPKVSKEETINNSEKLIGENEENQHESSTDNIKQTEDKNYTEHTETEETQEYTSTVNEEGYYENVPSARSDLNPATASNFTRSVIDRVNAGEANRPKADFIDVSSHNQTITVEQYRMMKTYGIKAVVVKLTEATSYFNPYAQSQIQNALSAGLKVSVYHYSHYTNTTSAQAEANYFASKAQMLNLSKEVVMVSDMEEKSMFNASLNDNTRVFKNTLNSKGYNKVGYYLSKSWLSESGGFFDANQFGKNNIWVAQYPYTPSASQNWNSDYSSWQWSSNFYFPGISHPFDVNTDYTGLFTQNEANNGWDNSISVTGKTTIQDIDGRENKLKISATINSGNATPYKVYFAIYTENNNQSDLIWHEAVQGSDSKWSKDINISDYGKSGRYIVHTYAQMDSTSSSQKMTGNDSFTISAPSLSGSIGPYSNGGFDVIINPVSKSGIKNVRVPSWSKSDQSDIKWYDAKLQSDGTYKARIEISNHNYNQGIYRVHGYVYTNNGLSAARSIGTTEVSVSQPIADIKISDSSGTETQFKADSTISMGSYGEPTILYHAVWSKENGQDDLIWYEAKKTGQNRYTSTFDTRNHKHVGEYIVHTYAKLADGSMKNISHDSFNVSSPSFRATIGKFDESKGSFEVMVTPSSKSGVKKIQVPVWSKSDQSDIKWYDAKLQSNGDYKTTVNISNHNYNDGIYRVHTYLYSGNGFRTARSVGTIEVKLDGIKGSTSIVNKDGKDKNYEATTKISMGGFGEPAMVYLATWSTKNNQKDLIWYPAQKVSNGTYKTTIDIKNHKNIGDYTVHTYVKMSNGRMKMVSDNSFNVKQPELKPSVENINKSKGTFDIRVAVKSASGVEKILIPVWTDKNQKDLIWYSAEKQKDGTYKATINKKDHYNKLDGYTAHVYVYNNNGVVSKCNAGQISF